MHALLVALTVLVAQTTDDENFQGKIEKITKTDPSISVRGPDSEPPRLFFLNKQTEFSRDGKPCKLAELAIGDTVALTWKMGRVGNNQRRLMKTLDVRPLLQPSKFKSGQIGYLPLQGD